MVKRRASFLLPLFLTAMLLNLALTAAVTNHCAVGTVHSYEATQAANELTSINDE